MRRIRSYGPSVVLLLTTVLVVVAGPYVAKEIVWAQTNAKIQLVRDSLSHNASLTELSNAFRGVAEVVAPSVVHVRVSSKQQATPRRGRTLEEDLLRRFFGPDRFRRPDNLDPWDEDQPAPDSPQDESEKGDDMDRYNAPREYGSGSGWVYDDQGHIVTNWHVVEDADVIKVRFQNGTERAAQLVGSDPKTDIAVIKIDDDDLHPATVSHDPVEQGDIVFAFGSPFRFEFSMSQGIVSGKGRHLGILSDRQGYEDFIQTDAAINPGNSGGPLTNIYGQVIGMNTAIATRTGAYNGLSFAIPAKIIENVVSQLIDKGRVSRGYLGIYITDLDPKLAKTFNFEGQGVLVQDPIKGGPAEEAGIQRGDIITQLDHDAVSTADELRNAIAAMPPDTRVNLTIFRDGKSLGLDLTIGQMPEKVGLAQSSPSQEQDASPQAEGAQALRKLGFERLSTFTKDLAERGKVDFTPGVLVRAVRPGSVAAAAGVERGDVITHVMGAAVPTPADLAGQIKDYDLSKGVRLTVVHRGISRFVLLELPGE